MGEIANVLKNAVDAASIKGSFFFSSLNDFHNNLKNHFNELSIASVSTGRHKNLLPEKAASFSIFVGCDLSCRLLK